MPAPAVIPAPRAYINAVAVKGFVVELWAVKELRRLSPTSLDWGWDRLLLRSVNIQKQRPRERKGVKAHPSN